MPTTHRRDIRDDPGFDVQAELLKRLEARLSTGGGTGGSGSAPHNSTDPLSARDRGAAVRSSQQGQRPYPVEDASTQQFLERTAQLEASLMKASMERGMVREGEEEGQGCGCVYVCDRRQRSAHHRVYTLSFGLPEWKQAGLECTNAKCVSERVEVVCVCVSV